MKQKKNIIKENQKSQEKSNKSKRSKKKKNLVHDFASDLHTVDLSFCVSWN